MFTLVRAAGGSPRTALATSALMAADNLLIVHGRIGTLDIYALAAMIWGVAFYLRGHTVLAGATIGVGACFKLVAPYALLVLAFLELFRRWSAGRSGPRPWRRLLTTVLVAAGVFLVLLAVLDQVFPPYDAAAARLVNGGPFDHLAHMVSYAAGQASPHGTHGIASYPWQWLGDYKPIVYLNIDPAHPAPGLYGIHPPVHFIGVISPPVMLLALPALLLAVVGLLRRSLLLGWLAPPGALTVLGLAWFLGTFVPFELVSAIWSRTSYLYYMVVVMPGIYVAIVDLLARARISSKLIAAWGFAVVVAAVIMYPLTPLP
jgi:predicted membrane-bound dolichyl-phosphate-mannose-protein mannosyltransferase